jgi:hypothetical protein
MTCLGTAATSDNPIDLPDELQLLTGLMERKRKSTAQNVKMGNSGRIDNMIRAA